MDPQPHIPDELTNPAVAVAAAMARAVLAAEHYRQTGTLPAWAAKEIRESS